jgi:hypothetical protein
MTLRVLRMSVAGALLSSAPASNLIASRALAGLVRYGTEGFSGTRTDGDSIHDVATQSGAL